MFSRHVELGQWEEAYRVASLGVTEADWRMLAMQVQDTQTKTYIIHFYRQTWRDNVSRDSPDPSLWHVLFTEPLSVLPLPAL